MIWGDLEHWEEEKNAYHPALQKAIQYLLETDLDSIEVGTHPIQGDDMYAMVQAPATVIRAERKSEHHAKYIDVQYLIGGGEELQVVARQSNSNVSVENELESKDYELYDEVAGENEIYLTPGMFVIYFPNDLHRPICGREGGVELKKVVIKINKSLLGLL
jgi:YhcH/YjgK/YiaL family protein